MNIKAAIENYLAVLAPDAIEPAERIQRLIVCLDELAMAAHKQDHTFDDRDYPQPPERNYGATRENVARLFPSLGFYNSAADISDNISQTTLVVGDAIDDIVDIARDLNEVLWRFNNTSDDDALFHFQLYFRSHWGAHLRQLQLYLHDAYWQSAS